MPALQFHRLYESLHRQADLWQQQAHGVSFTTEEEVMALAQEMFATEEDNTSAFVQPFQSSCCGDERSATCCGKEMTDIQAAVERTKPTGMPSTTWLHLLLVRERFLAPFASQPELREELRAQLTLPASESLLSEEIKRLQHLLDFFEAT